MRKLQGAKRIHMYLIIAVLVVGKDFLKTETSGLTLKISSGVYGRMRNLSMRHRESQSSEEIV